MWPLTKVPSQDLAAHLHIFCMSCSDNPATISSIDLNSPSLYSVRCDRLLPLVSIPLLETLLDSPEVCLHWVEPRWILCRVHYEGMIVVCQLDYRCMVMDAGIVHDQHYRSSIVFRLWSQMPQRLMQEVLKHGGIYSSFYKLVGKYMILCNSCNQKHRVFLCLSQLWLLLQSPVKQPVRTQICILILEKELPKCLSGLENGNIRVGCLLWSWLLWWKWSLCLNL